MRKSTNAEAYRAMRNAADTFTGRLSAVRLHGYRAATIPAGTLHAKPARLLRRTLDRTAGAPIDPDMPVYAVSCDGTPIAWLTHHARVVTPAADLSPFQTRHQRESARALTDVHLWVIVDLADARDRREGRTADGPAGDPCANRHHPPQIRIAAQHDLSRTWWLPISGDRAATLHAAGQLAGTHEIRVIQAVGYGYYARRSNRLDLAVLCTVHRLADAHGVPPSVVGDWLADAEPTGQPDALAAAFAAAYQGLYPNRDSFVDQVLTERGWRAAMTTAGMPDRYVDRSTLSADLFSAYRDISVGAGGIAVVRRTRARG
ncbi:hypothetical protein [Spirilliplanes yamanashiensis]|uniref:Uncharacterized protein n=1 Tax=Spirilliplanes yamanashiensis TaxID=42233 RepID=A0A8J4DMN2_9ACTN|nr:hypothetical protein [Spirilliplanes yamanashiensis]MDP9818485.1 hypothetical protein [Spirilliplanes yamanashiensis]GIJ06389.1 hypothetical protein Sya03_57410 [Spirilliplanes yamanashiensis]